MIDQQTHSEISIYVEMALLLLFFGCKNKTFF